MMKRPPLNEFFSLYYGAIAVEGATTGPGNASGTSFIDAGLAGAGVGSYFPMLAVIYVGESRRVDSLETTGFNDATGEVTLASAYKGVAAAIPAGVRYQIRMRARPVNIDLLGLTTFGQETAPATNANGLNWVDILDRSILALPTKICGFRVTVAGTWAGNAIVRIVTGAGVKIFPFKDEYVQGVDFASGASVIFNFLVEVPVANGYKFQFRSDNAGDGAGDTVQLNNLDVIAIG